MHLHEKLSNCLLFTGIEPAEREQMLRCLSAKTAHYEKGAAIWREGDPALDLGVVLEGTVRIERIDYYGNRSIIGQMGPGEIFGESFACSSMAQLPVDVVAVERSCILTVSVSRVMTSCSQACAFHARLCRNLLQVVAEKNQKLNNKLYLTSRRSTRERLMTYLVQQAKEHGSNTFTIAYNRQALADYLEVDRSGLSAEIGKLTREGYLISQRNRFTLLRRYLPA